MAADIFNSPDRDAFFRSIEFPWYNLPPSSDPTGQPQPYGLYHCQPVAPQTIQDLRHASEAVGVVLLEAWDVVRQLDDEDLDYYGFPEETWQVIRADQHAPWCMRLDWCWNDRTKTYKVVEVNSQTPSFWYEPTIGNGQAASHFGLQPLDAEPEKLLRSSIQVQLQRAATKLGKPLPQCRIGFTALNNPEDLNTMAWLSHYVPDGQVFPLENLLLDNGRHLYDRERRQPIDILFLWYPLEWLILDRDSEGEYLWPEVERLILNNKLAIVNFGSAFALQSKGVFALIQELASLPRRGYANGHLSPAAAATVKQYFPKTVLDEAEIGDSYFAKPIFGRQGEGAVAIIDGEEAFSGSMADPFYTEQPYIYQELLDFPTMSLAGQEMTELWGVWLYNDGSDRLVADALGKRLSKSKVTDDGAYWCPIGLL